MAVGLVVTYPEITLQDWNRVLDAVDLRSQWADGCVLHSAGDRGGGVLTFEVWSSRQDFDRFHEERLVWAFREALRRPPPKPQVSQVDLARVEAP
jgi:hypothetical protein